MMDSQQKTRHANESEKALKHPLVQDVIEEQLLNLHATKDSLVKYGLMKIAMYAAQVARAQALGIDPDELRTTDVEYAQHCERLEAICEKNNIPVIAVDPAASEEGGDA